MLIKKYKKFTESLESRSVNTETIEFLLGYKLGISKFGIKNYTINNGLVDVDGDVYFDNTSSKNLTKLPFPFGKVTGNFHISESFITSLENFPSFVGGSINISGNKLTSLKGLRNLIVNGDFFCYDNPLESFDDCPKIIKGGLYCRNTITPLYGLEDYPISIIDSIRANVDEKSKLYYNNTNQSILNPSRYDVNQLFKKICDMVNANRDEFLPLLDNKKQFHIKLILLDPDLVKYYNKWSPLDSKGAKLIF